MAADKPGKSVSVDHPGVQRGEKPADPRGRDRGRVGSTRTRTTSSSWKTVPPTATTEVAGGASGQSRRSCGSSISRAMRRRARDFRRASARQGEAIVTLDADLQNDPADIPKLLAELERLRRRVGWRTTRKDTWTKRLTSKFANRVRRWATGDGIKIPAVRSRRSGARPSARSSSSPACTASSGRSHVRGAHDSRGAGEPPPGSFGQIQVQHFQQGPAAHRRPSRRDVDARDACGTASCARIEGAALQALLEHFGAGEFWCCFSASGAGRLLHAVVGAVAGERAREEEHGPPRRSGT